MLLVEGSNENLAFIGKGYDMVVGYVNEQWQNIHSRHVNFADHRKKNEHGQDKCSEGNSVENHYELILLRGSLEQFEDIQDRIFSESFQKVIIGVVSDEVYILLVFGKAGQVEVSHSEDRTADLENSLSERKLKSLQVHVLL